MLMPGANTTLSGCTRTFLTSKGAIDGARLEPVQLWNLHKDRPIVVRYDLPAIARAVKPSTFRDRVPSLWRYRELLPLPLDVEPVTLGEGMTPLLPCPRLGQQLGLSHLLDQGRIATADGQLQEPRHDGGRQHGEAARRETRWRCRRRATPAAPRRPMPPAPGMRVLRLHARTTRRSSTRWRRTLYGAKAFRVNGLINDCGKIVQATAPTAMGWFDLSTLKEPYRLEGKKTMGLELAEQFDWKLPDVILYPTGGGTGLIGMWKAFHELRRTRLARRIERMPRLYSCQSDGCAPIVRAFESGERFADAVRECEDSRQRPARAGRGRRFHDARRHPCQRRQSLARAVRTRSRTGWFDLRRPKASACVPRPPFVSIVSRRCMIGAKSSPTRRSSFSIPARRRNIWKRYRCICRKSIELRRRRPNCWRLRLR